MTKLTLIIASLALALTAACGDNVSDVGPGSLIVIIPDEGRAIDALESAEEVGFVDPIFYEDAGYITAIGDLSLAPEALDMPGIADVLPADAIEGNDSWDDRVVWDRDQAFDLGREIVNQTPNEYWEQRTEWNGQLSLTNAPDAVKRDRMIDWDSSLTRR
mgnify:CR=1 FL=1